jgi:hypothetical protein
MSTTSSAPQTPVADRCRGLMSELVLRCGRGDETALGDLFDITFFFVAATLSRGRMPSADVDDEVVDAYRRIWRRSVGYRPGEQSVLAWVFDQTVDVEEAVPHQRRQPVTA